MSKFLQAGDLDRKVQVLRFTETAPGTWAWTREALSWAHVERSSRRAVFSPSARAAPGALLTMRRHPSRTRQKLLRVGDTDFLVVGIRTLEESPGYVEIEAAEIRLRAFRAEPQKRTGRDALNRPTAVEVPAFTFPAVLSEQYRRNEEDEIYRTDLSRRVLVTPPEIRLRPGDLVRQEGDAPYTVRTVGDLDPDRAEYIIEREVDV